ncbi:MAG: WD40 repeat domain-containing protein [bacterium]
MKKKIIFFLYLFVSLFFFSPKLDAAFYNPTPYTQNFGTSAYATTWSPNGSYLAVGGINFPNDIGIYSWDGAYLTQKDTEIFGNSVKALDWSPDGKFLTVGGDNPTYPLIVYQWDGNSLTLTTSKYHGTEVRATAWSPNGNCLAVGGVWGYNDLALYNWNGTDSLTLTTSKSHGTQVNALAWHPDGTKLAVAGNNSTKDLILYNWNGSTLTSVNVQDHGTEAYALAWTLTGSWLAVGGNYGDNDVALYTLSGPSTLTLTTSISFGTQANTLSWSFDDRYLTIGGVNGSTDLVTYEWDGATLTKIYNSQISYGNAVYSADWSPYADYLAVAGDNGTSNLNIYSIHGYLNGTKNNIKLTDHFLFTHGGYAQDNVNITNGCTVLPAQTLKLALLAPLSGGLDLRDTGILELEDDLYLDANVTLSSGGIINGQNHAIYLGNNLIIPDNSIIYITSDTIIDGDGHDLILGHASQFSIDSNVTLTLRNLTLKNNLNTIDYPPVKPTDINSKLALDKITLAPSSDVYFDNGQLFIHNDVIFTGTSKFIYSSLCQSYIASNALLYFDNNTTFSFAPYLSTNKDLIYMQDKSSTLYLNGATLATTHTGLRLTRGKLLLDNDITITCRYYEGSHKQAATNSFVFGNSALGADHDLNIKLLSGANVNIHGIIKYDCTE